MFHAACKDSLFAPTKNLMAGLEKYHTSVPWMFSCVQLLPVHMRGWRNGRTVLLA
jgi:hypothetical protein